MAAMNLKRTLLAVGFAFATLNTSLAADKRTELETEVKEAIALLQKADSSLARFFNSSAGYAVFPKVAKGGLGIGAARGKGQLFEGGKVVGETRLTQVTIGLQAGGQVYSEVIFFENATTLTNFKEGNFEFSAQVSAVAAAEGVARNAKFEHGVAVFTLAKAGLMYEASVGGQKFSFEPYGK
jgi:lipid-binding SYLF domain-containing protein